MLGKPELVPLYVSLRCSGDIHWGTFSAAMPSFGLSRRRALQRVIVWGQYMTVARCGGEENGRLDDPAYRVPGPR